MDFKSVASYMGTIFEAMGILSLLPAIVSWLYGESVFVPFMLTAAIFFGAGLFMDRKFEKGEMGVGTVMVLSVLALVSASLIGAIPFLFYTTPANAVFESVSGFTTTALTTLNPEILPHSMLFWRSLTQWLGGLGVIMAFIMLASTPGVSSYHLHGPEARKNRIEPTVFDTVKKAWKVYGMLTVAGVVLLALAGMPVFDSILHSFSSVSTGGFSSKAGSIADYHNISITITIALLTILGSTSFFIYNSMSKRDFGQYFRNPETRLFWLLALAFGLALSVAFASFGTGIFQAVSALTTSGFYTTAITGDLSKLLLVLLMIAGGCSASAAGGLKLVRMGVLARAVPWVEKKMILPSTAVVPFKFGGKVMDEHEVTIISVFAVMYIALLGASTLALSFMGYAPLDSFFQAASAGGNVGLSVIPVASLPFAGKAVLMACMLLGRLEIFPFAALLMAIFRVRGSRA